MLFHPLPLIASVTTCLSSRSHPFQIFYFPLQYQPRQPHLGCSCFVFRVSPAFVIFIAVGKTDSLEDLATDAEDEDVAQLLHNYRALRSTIEVLRFRQAHQDFRISTEQRGGAVKPTPTPARGSALEHHQRCRGWLCHPHRSRFLEG